VESHPLTDSEFHIDRDRSADAALSDHVPVICILRTVSR
jgi:hypothetical protein